MPRSCEHDAQITTVEKNGNEIVTEIYCHFCETRWTYRIDAIDIVENMEAWDVEYQIIGDEEPYRPYKPYRKIA